MLSGRAWLLVGAVQVVVACALLLGWRRLLLLAARHSIAVMGRTPPGPSPAKYGRWLYGAVLVVLAAAGAGTGQWNVVVGAAWFRTAGGVLMALAAIAFFELVHGRR